MRVALILFGLFTVSVVAATVLWIAPTFRWEGTADATEGAILICYVVSPWAAAFAFAAHRPTRTRLIAMILCSVVPMPLVALAYYEQLYGSSTDPNGALIFAAMPMHQLGVIVLTGLIIWTRELWAAKRS